MEVKELLDYLKKSKINIPLTLLSQNDFIYKEYETQMFLESLIFDEFLKLDHNILKNFDSEKLKINLVLYDNDPKKIKSYLSLSGDNLEKIVPGSFNVEHRYLTRSNIPSYELVFKNFMINKVIFEKFTKESSETQ